MAVGAHDEQVDVFFLSGLDDGFPGALGVQYAQVCLDALGGEFL